MARNPCAVISSNSFFDEIFFNNFGGNVLRFRNFGSFQLWHHRCFNGFGNWFFQMFNFSFDNFRCFNNRYFRF